MTFSALQSLRGIFAIFIMLHHLGLFPAGGDWGVAFFIMLSGFVMSAGYAARVREGRIHYGPYLMRRFRRIYPYHLVGFLAALLLIRPVVGLDDPFAWGANLTMLQSWIPLPEFYFSFDSPSWCLSDLFFCYALFPLLILFDSKIWPLWKLAVLVLPAYIFGLFMIDEYYWTSLFYINPFFRLYDFVIGMVLWHMYDTEDGEIMCMAMGNAPFWEKTGMEMLLIGVFFCCVLLYPDIPEDVAMVSLWWIPAAMTILTFSHMAGCGGLLTRLLELPLFVRFGDLSFPFYMLHVPVIYGWLRVAPHLGVTSDVHLIGLLPVLLTTTLLAYICERLISRPKRPNPSPTT